MTLTSQQAALLLCRIPNLGLSTIVMEQVMCLKLLLTNGYKLME